MFINNNYWYNLYMQKLSTFLNYFITDIAISFLIFAFSMSIFTKSISISLAIIFYAIFTFAFFAIKNKTEEKNHVALSEKELFKRYQTAFRLMPKEEILSLIASSNSLEDFEIDKQNRFLITQDNLYSFNFYEDELSLNEFLKIISNMPTRNINSLYIYCFSNNNECISYANAISDFTVEIVPFEKLYLDIRDSYSPQISEKIPLKYSKKFSEIAKELIAKKNARGYALSAILILILSFVSPFKLYYQIAASILILIAVIILFINH